jgi:hypothetical protein
MYYLLFSLASVLSAFSFGQYFVCSSFWSVYCVLFLQKEEQTKYWPKEKADNTLAKGKSR